MCDINKETRYKSRIVYKICFKINDKYYSYFAGMLIKEGPVKLETNSPTRFLMRSPLGTYFNKYPSHSAHYNKNLLGRTSGFASYVVAKNFLIHIKSYLKPENRVQVVLLKIKIGGSIFKGSTQGISIYVPSDEVTYAGSEILSIEEIE